MNWLLLGVLAIIGVCVFHGYKSGLVKMLFSVATFLITIVLVRMLAPVGVQMLKSNEGIYNGIKAPIEKMLDEKIDGQIKTEDVLESCGISEDVKENILHAAEQNGVSEVNVFTPEIKRVAADCLTLRIIDLIAYIVLFILINIVLRVLAAVLDVFSKLPVIKTVNTLAGSVVGAVEGLIVVWICFIVITIFGTTGWGNQCFEWIGESTILSILYAENLFLVFI